MSDVEHLLWQRLYQPGTGFSSAIDEAYLDLGAFGTAVIFVGQRMMARCCFSAGR